MGKSNAGNTEAGGTEPWDTISAYGQVDDFDLHPILRRAYRVAVLIERAPHASIEQTTASSAAFDLVKEINDVVLVLKGQAMLARAKADAYDLLIAKQPPEPADDAAVMWARDLDGTGSWHPCAKGDPGAVMFRAVDLVSNDALRGDRL